MTTDDYVLVGVLDKIEMIIGIEKFDDTKIFIDAYNKLADEVTLKNAVILISCAKNDAYKFYLRIFLEGALAA